MYKVIWVAGMQRSGSMWTYNVVRELARRAGFRVLPEEVLITDQQSADYVNQQVPAHPDPRTVFVLKTHTSLDSVPPNHFVITNIRDIRDAMVSFMRFMRVDFDKALQNSLAVIEIADYYLRLPENKRLVLRYDDLNRDPAATVSRLADGIGLSVEEGEAASVAARFSKEKVRVLTENKDRSIREAARIGRTLEGEFLMERGDGLLATFDRSTGFQSNHVSDYRDGDWHRLLSEDQIGVLDRVFGGWLRQNGYAT